MKIIKNVDSFLYSYFLDSYKVNGMWKAVDEKRITIKTIDGINELPLNPQP